MATERAPEQFMERHPDIRDLRDRYDRAAETPQAWVVEGLTFLAGMYTAVSAWVVGFHNDAPAMTAVNVVVGLSVAALAVAFGAFYGHTHGLSWVLPALGLWTIIAPWVVREIDRTNDLTASNVIVGVVIVLLGLAVTAMSRMREREPMRESM